MLLDPAFRLDMCHATCCILLETCDKGGWGQILHYFALLPAHFQSFRAKIWFQIQVINLSISNNKRVYHLCFSLFQSYNQHKNTHTHIQNKLENNNQHGTNKCQWVSQSVILLIRFCSHLPFKDNTGPDYVFLLYHHCICWSPTISRAKKPEKVTW